ncbi:MAG: LptA/OstA family protein [Pseudomonadota bacterium]
MTLLRVLTVCALMVPSFALAQGLQVAFAGFNQDGDLPIEIAADSMAIDQVDGSALLTGNVVIGQGELRLAAPRVTVNYADTGGISRIFAEGGVTFVTPEEEAESRTALYELSDDSIFLSGDVLLIQGSNAVSSDTMRVDLASGTALLEGRVRTVLQSNE